MTAEQFTDFVDGHINDFTAGEITANDFRDAVLDILIRTVFDNDALMEHYRRKFEEEAKAWEFQMMVKH